MNNELWFFKNSMSSFLNAVWITTWSFQNTAMSYHGELVTQYDKHSYHSQKLWKWVLAPTPSYLGEFILVT